MTNSPRRVRRRHPNGSRPAPRTNPAVAVAAEAGPSRRDAPSERAGSARPGPVAAKPSHGALVCQAPEALSFDDFDGTSMFDTLGKVRAVPAREASRAIVCRSIADARGYSKDELFALAEVGYHYFRSGGLRLALVVFEGLTAIEPDEPYFWLALGLVTDYLDDKERARSCYQTAARLDPDDARPEINLAELFLERGERVGAARHLQRGLRKAVRAEDDALEQKAYALSSLSGLPLRSAA